MLSSKCKVCKSGVNNHLKIAYTHNDEHLIISYHEIHYTHDGLHSHE